MLARHTEFPRKTNDPEVITIFNSKFISRSQGKSATISIITFAARNSKQRFRSKRFVKAEIRRGARAFADLQILVCNANYQRDIPSRAGLVVASITVFAFAFKAGKIEKRVTT